MFHFKKEPAPHTDDLLAPVGGQVLSLSTVSDPVFAQKMMGDGLAIKPNEGDSVVVAPISGEVTVAQGHAFGIRRDDGLEVLVHIGVDTVNLQGAPFTIHTKQGKTVRAGAKMVTVDWAQITAAKLDPTVMVLITNTKTNLAQLKVNYQQIASGAVVGQATAK
ncbi:MULTISPECIES: PTS sugar transporter subunit IIA [Lapidilactobacillus]|uniref:PTS glucose transporter subunit IIA n=1 Tax=Lapidilactobacillus achengensis TaxID=2486000 RepID=A0ABW1UNV3_9LACO|nr:MULTISPECIES: PTS glucose transporter subunit IIA [Lapidilactobacillus]